MDAILPINQERICKMVKPELLKQRREANKRKPAFVEKESNFSASVKKRWRMPRGKHSGQRQYHKGRPAMPTPGYGAPKEVRGLHHSGLEVVLINNKSELEKLNPNTQGMLISGKVGNKKRLELINLATEKKITILNYLKPTEVSEKLSKEFMARKKDKQEKLQQMSKKEESRKKKAEEKAKKEEEKKIEKNEGSVEEKVKEETDKQKKIAEKTITKKQ